MAWHGQRNRLHSKVIRHSGRELESAWTGDTQKGIRVFLTSKGNSVPMGWQEACNTIFSTSTDQHNAVMGASECHSR